MALTNVLLYEALKPLVGEDAARLMAEVVPPAENIALKSDIAELRHEMNEKFAEIKGQMHAETNRTIRWMMGFLITAWIGSFGSLVAILQLR